MRTAFFPDSFVEVNGVAMTSNRLVNFARARGIDFLCVHAGPETKVQIDGSVTDISLKRTVLSIGMDEGLAFDPLFQRHVNLVLRELFSFKPDVIHITGLNDVSIIGAYLAWKLKLPLIASWHTNLHEFAARRIRKNLSFLPQSVSNTIADFAERQILAGAMLYYKMPKMILAPNQELIDLLSERTEREVRLMARGVDTVLFDPAKRNRDDNKLKFGFVGRLQAEKNPRVLVDVERCLLENGVEDFEFLIVGEGSERGWLEKHLTRAVFTGFLSGESLAEAYADMDVFLFPSETDAFGNVAQEAMASGVPVITSDVGGPKFIIRESENGFIAREGKEYGSFCVKLAKDPALLHEMKGAARRFALTRSWDAVFEEVFDAYRAVAFGR